MNQLIIDEEKCWGCGKCQERCGIKKVISVNGSGRASYKKDRSECIECYRCLMMCPHDAILGGNGTITVSRVNGKPLPHSSVTSAVSFDKNRGFF